MSPSVELARPGRRVDLEVWVRRGCALIVADVAAYASYEHQREFALAGGADATTAALWPLSVDGLLVLATVGLRKPGHQSSRRARVVVWSTFLAGIAVSLAANIAAAPMLSWQPVLVAGWPPVALLLAVELLAHRPHRRGPTETEPTTGESTMAVSTGEPDSETNRESGTVVSIAEVAPATESGGSRAQQVMWAHFVREQSRGRNPERRRAGSGRRHK